MRTRAERRHRHVPHPRRADLHTSSGIGDRAADAISAFTGGWTFIGLHAVWFACWLLLHLDINLLTLIVSLEAIFLTSFVLMAEHRQSERDHAVQSREAEEVEQNLLLTQQIHHLSGEIHTLTQALHAHALQDKE